MDIAAWLRGLGLERYEAAFGESDVDAEVLPQLTAEDLISIGVTSVGHRRKLLAGIAALGASDAPPALRPSIAAVGGSPLPNPPPLAGEGRVEAERRQLTVMFCDLVGSTALSARLDPEDLRAVIGAYHRCAAKVIGRGGGFVAKYMGDGVLAYFGYPRADEHDAERAVRAGLKLVEKVAGLDTVAAAPLQVRVGIGTGLVVVGDLIGQGAAQEQAVVGETPNLAARLQALAEPGTVVIGPSTRRLTGGSVRLRGSRRGRDQGLCRAGHRLAGAARERGREPLRGAARGRHAARRPRRGAGAAAAPLATSQERRGLRRAGVGRAGHRQVASRADPARAAERRAAHPLAPVLLAAPPGQRALPDDHAARTGGRVPARGHRRAAARQARGGARAGDQRSRRGRPAARGIAVAPGRRALSAAQPHPAEAKREDASGAGGPGRRAGGAAAGADAVRGRAVERSDLARATGLDHRSGARTSGPADR